MMKRILSSLILALALCFSWAGAALAEDYKNLIDWDTKTPLVSSDPAGHRDGMDLGNPNNPEGKLDVGMMECNLGADKTLNIIITNGYPGYQEYVESRIVNVSKVPVTITDPQVLNDDLKGVILVKLLDKQTGHDLKGQVIPVNSGVPVRLICRILDTAEQSSVYTFSVAIHAEQKIDNDGGGGDPGGGGGAGLEEESVSPPAQPQVKNPAGDSNGGQILEGVEPPQEAVELPLIPAELPYTGGNIALFIGTGFALGGIGLILRRNNEQD